MLECVSVDEAATEVVGLDGGDAEGGEDLDLVAGGIGLQGGVAVEDVVGADGQGVAGVDNGIARIDDGVTGVDDGIARVDGTVGGGDDGVQVVVFGINT